MKNRLFDDTFEILRYNSFFKTFFLLLTSFFLSWNLLSEVNFHKFCLTNFFSNISYYFTNFSAFNMFKFVSMFIIFFSFILISEILFTYYIYRRRVRFGKFITNIFETFSNFILMSAISVFINLTLLLAFILISIYLSNFFHFPIIDAIYYLTITNIFLGISVFMLYFDLYLPHIFIHKDPKFAFEETKEVFQETFLRILLLYTIRFFIIFIIIECKTYLLNLFSRFISFDSYALSLFNGAEYFQKEILIFFNHLEKVVIILPIILPIYYLNKVIFMNFILKRK